MNELTKGESLYLGIDGGATGTDLALEAEDGSRLRQLRLPPSNPFDIGMERAQAVLSDGIGEICAGLDRSRIYLFAGLSGGKTGGNVQSFLSFFEGFGFRRAACDSDTVTAVAVGLKGKNGLVAITGTGSAICVARDGETEIVGGHGYLFDKGCSGYDLGLAALRESFCAADGIRPPSLLTDLVNEACGGQVSDRIHDFYNSGKALIASFAPLVFRAAAQWDLSAQRLIAESAAALAALIRAGAARLAEEDRRIVLVGGMTHFETQIRPPLEAALADTGWELSFCREKPIAGALFLARALKEK